MLKRTLSKLFDVFKFKQTMDNNKSLENQLENEILTEDFHNRVKHFNKLHTFALIKDYLYKKHPDIFSQLRQDEQAEAVEHFAEKLFDNKLMDSNYIVKPAILECLQGK